MIGVASVSVLVGVFVASCVEVTEMVIIVVGVGATRGWRSTWIGVGAGLTVLAGIIAGLGQALQLIPIDTVRIIIGGLLLTFGLQWYRQGVIQTAADGFGGGTEEEDAVDAGSGGRGIDWTAFVLAFKGVLLEGLEVAFIVVAFGAGGGSTGSGTTGGSYGAAYVGAGAAFVVIGLLGFAAKRRLERVPGRSLKFGVGGLLATFGTFWSLEGLGVHWPGGDLSLAWLYALYLGSTFAMRLAVRAGMFGPAPESSLEDPGPAGASGLAPASASAIRDFQSEHGLAVDGVVGRETQAAVRAVRADSSEDGDRSLTGVDSGDPDAVSTLQRRLGLPASGRIDGLTRGAVRLVQRPGFVDPLDVEAVRRFQREHSLEPTGAVDELTRVAITAVLADPGREAQSERHGQRSGAPDPIAALRDIDPADAGSVARFQRSLNIRQSGDIDDETRGAMRALRTWLVVDPTSEDAVRRAQGRHGLTADGVIGPETRAAIAEERRTMTEHRTAPPLSEPDPYHQASVVTFQQRHRLPETGVIDAATRARILWEREHHLSVDAASADSVRHFQSEHGLDADGIIGGETRAALRAARREREVTGDKQRRERYGDDAAAHDGRVLDPADADAVRRFQRRHRLREDARIGARTQTAMRSVRRERRRSNGNETGHDDN